MKLTAALLLLFSFAADAAETLPVPRFTDSDRRQKLAKAFPEIDQIFERYLKARAIPGLVYGIVVDGELAHVKTYGVRDRTANDPVQPGTVFRIASMTKSFTALAVLKLRDEGKLSLDDAVSKWIPEFRDDMYPTRDTAPVRVRQLLTHGVGLPEDNPWGDQQLGVTDEVLTAWLKKGLPFSTAPDTEYEYSNYGFALAGRVVAKASKRPYREYLEKEILAPLGMKASSLEATAVPENIRATGYRRLPNGNYEVEPSLAHGAFGAMGGLLTSAEDLARYVAFMLSAWPPRDDPERGPVRRSSVREMQRMWRTGNLIVNRPEGGTLRAVSDGYGYGLRVHADCRFRHNVGHGGGLPGFGSYMYWLPEYGIGMFAMANLTYAGPAGSIQEAFEALQKTGGLERRKLPPAPALTQAQSEITSLYQQWDDKRAEALAADNLFKDIPAKTRREEIESLRKDLGNCRSSGPVEAENLLRGKFRMACDSGQVEVTFTLAPTNPPTVQFLRFAPIKALSTSAKAAAEGLVALLASPTQDGITAIGAPGEPFLTQKPRLDAVHRAYGSCRFNDVLGGNGRTSIRVRLECDKAPVEALIYADDSGKIQSVFFNKPADSACVP